MSAVGLFLSVVCVAAPSTPELDALYARRDEPEPAHRLETGFAEALAVPSPDFAVLWRAARYKWWLADGAQGNSRERLAREAWDLAERAVKLRPDRVEGHFFAAVAIGAYSQAAGILAALTQGLEPKFNAHADAALKLDAGFAFSGPRLAKGRYFDELPWPLRRLDKSEQLLREAIANTPEALRAYVYLAETLWHEDKKAKAQEVLQRALAGDLRYDPPEARRAQAMARSLQQKMAEEPEESTGAPP